MSHCETPLAFGRFQSLQLVRRDGETTFHDAFDPELGQKVSLLTWPAGPDSAEEDRLAFRLRRMRHANVVSVLDAGLEGDVAFVAAECMQAEPLSAFLARAGRIPVVQGLALVLQLLSAIEHAHARRMVHAGIDLEHVQVTPGGQPKLPAAGWSLSTDAQANLEAVARIARVLLAGTCPPELRHALDEVLARAEASEPQTRYQRADEFLHALLAAARRPVTERPAAIACLAPAQPEPAAALPVAAAHIAQASPRTRHKASRRIHGGHALLTACIVAAFLLPRLAGNGSFTGSEEARASATTSALGAPPALLAQASAAPEPVAPPPVAPETVASETAASETAAPETPAPPAPEAAAPEAAAPEVAAPAAAAPEAPTPAAAAPAAAVPQAAVPQAAVPQAAVPQAAVPEAAVPQAAAPQAPAPQAAAPQAAAPQAPAPQAAAPEPVAPRTVAPPPPAASVARPVAVARPPIARPPVARPAVRHATRARSTQPIRQARASKAPITHARAARPRVAIPVRAAFNCPYEWRFTREWCQAEQCNRPEMRQNPVCVRMLAQERATFERLRGTPD